MENSNKSSERKDTESKAYEYRYIWVFLDKKNACIKYWNAQQEDKICFLIVIEWVNTKRHIIAKTLF